MVAAHEKNRQLIDRKPQLKKKETTGAQALVERGEVSQEKAAEIAGLDRKQFLMALAREKAQAFLVDFEDLGRELHLG